MYDSLSKPSSQDIVWNEIQNGDHYVRLLAMHRQKNGEHLFQYLKPPSLFSNFHTRCINQTYFSMIEKEGT